MRNIRITLPAYYAAKSMIDRISVPMAVPGSPQWYGAGAVEAEPGSGKSAVADQLQQDKAGKHIIITRCTSAHRPTSFLRDILAKLGWEERRNDAQYLIRRIGWVLEQPDLHNVGPAKTVLIFDDIQELVYGDRSCLPLIKAIINYGCCPVVLLGHPRAFQELLSHKETLDFGWRFRERIGIQPLDFVQFSEFLEKIAELEYTPAARKALYQLTGGRTGYIVNCLSALDGLKFSKVKTIDVQEVQQHCAIFRQGGRGR